MPQDEFEEAKELPALKRIELLLNKLDVATVMRSHRIDQ
jgi:hypothetical protein